MTLEEIHVALNNAFGDRTRNGEVTLNTLTDKRNNISISMLADRLYNRGKEVFTIEECYIEDKLDIIVTSYNSVAAYNAMLYNNVRFSNDSKPDSYMSLEEVSELVFKQIEQFIKNTAGNKVSKTTSDLKQVQYDHLAMMTLY